MNTYEVLLQRENGINKTVMVHDCMYEDEARILAESQYGLPVLRVLYKGSTQSSVDSNNFGGNTLHYNPYFKAIDFRGLTGAAGLLMVFAGIIILAEFWYLFVGGAIGYCSWKVFGFGDDDDDKEDE